MCFKNDFSFHSTLYYFSTSKIVVVCSIAFGLSLRMVRGHLRRMNSAVVEGSVGVCWFTVLLVSSVPLWMFCLILLIIVISVGVLKYLLLFN